MGRTVMPAQGWSSSGGRWYIMHYVYILGSNKTGRKYIGQTSNLKNRIAEHNAKLTKSTKPGVPWKLIYYEAFWDKTDALREERFLKSGKGRERIKHLFDD